MGLGHRLHQGQAQPRSGLGTAVLEPHEALHDPGPVLLRHAGAGVGDRALDLPRRALAHPQHHGSAGGCVLDGIIQQIGHGLPGEIRVAAHHQPLGIFRREFEPLVLAQGGIELRQPLAQR